VRFITLCHEPFYCKQGRGNPFKKPTFCFFYLGQSKIVKVSVVMMGGKMTDLATWKIDEDDDFMGLQILKG